MGISIGNSEISTATGIYCGSRKLRPDGGGGLPSAYQEVYWIASSGSQYINTGYTPTTNTTFDIKYIVTSINTNNAVFGCRKEYNQNAYYIGYNGYNSFYCFGNNHADTNTLNFKSTTMNTITYNGTSLSDGTNSVNVSVNTSPLGNIYIFAGNWNGSASEYSNIKLYYCKLSENGTLVRDLVPCYRKSDSVIGLYDLVNDTFYTNSGSGTFTKGGDVN